MTLKRLPIYFALLPTCLFFLAGCSSVPITGRQQLNLVPEESLVQTSAQQYQQILQEAPVETGTAASRQVKQVGQQVAAAVEEYLRQQGQMDLLQEMNWEFTLIDSPEINAWAMPGGKVAVYKGLLDVANTDAQLAAVIGHEIAHIIARHGNERMSQQLLTQMGGMALSTVLSTQPEASQELWMRVFGAGAQVGVMLPFSRLQEKEADHLGLIFMAMAGYNPQAALEVWQEMAQQGGGAGAPPFLSTHPTDQQRIEHIRELMPEAMQYYRG